MPSETRSGWVSARKSFANAFKQQQLPAWQPIWSPSWVIPAFFAAGLIFIPVGIVVLKASEDIVEVKEYYTPCRQQDASGNCTLQLYVPKLMNAPVYVYYHLENYYQNHRRYVKSRSDAQLRGDDLTSPDQMKDCQPIVNNSPKTCTRGEEGSCRDPCGLIAWSLFNDTYYNLVKEDGSDVPWRTNGIAWKSDFKKYKNKAKCEDAQGNFVKNDSIGCIQNVEDESFMVWMRTAAMNRFRKLHRIIDQDLSPGTYNMTITNIYPVDAFDGKKAVIVSTATWIGGKNQFLGIGYLTVGALCIMLAAGFLAKHLHSPRKLGDGRYLTWKRTEAPAQT